MQITETNSPFIKKYSRNPLDIPTYDGMGVVHPTILFFPRGFDGYKFWLYYTPFPPEKAENPCLVRSNNGTNFIDKGVSNPLITPSRSGFDNCHLEDPDVIYENGKFIMLYAGHRSDGISQIGLAESYDGINFTKSERNPILGPTQYWELTQDLECPAAFFDGKIFHVLYEAKGSRRVGYAFGESLHDLRKHPGNPVLEGSPPTLAQRLGKNFPFSLLFRVHSPANGTWDTEAVNHVRIFELDDHYYIFYTGRNRPWNHGPIMSLGLAETTDFLTWHKYHKNPLVLPSKGWESQHIYRACPVVVGNQIYLYYSAFSSENIPHIGLAFLDPKLFSNMS